MNKKNLTGKITIVAGGASAIGIGIVRALLMGNATVIVPSSNAEEIDVLKSQTSDILAGGLITVPTDVMDYDKAADIAETIRQRFGKLDLVVAALNKGLSNRLLTEMEITDWQKMVDENISHYFIAGRICLHLMKEQNSGVFINICDADLILTASCSPLARIALDGQMELSLIFSEEIAPHAIRLYHLFVNNIDAIPTSPCFSEIQRRMTPEMIGHHVIRLYQGEVEEPEKLFQHFLGRPLPPRYVSSFPPTAS